MSDMQVNVETRNIMKPTRRELMQSVRFAESRTLQRRVVRTQHTLTVKETFKVASRTGLDRKQSIKNHIASFFIGVCVNIIFFLIGITLLAAVNLNFPNHDAAIPSDKETACFKVMAQNYNLRHGTVISTKNGVMFTYKRGNKIILNGCEDYA